MARHATLSLALCLLVSPAFAQPDRSAHSPRGMPDLERTEDGWAYTIRDGDTLSDVAVRLDVTVAELLAWNEGLDADRIRSGQTLRVEGGRRRVEHVVRAGESLSRIAARYEVRIDELLRWNAGMTRDRVREGRRLVVLTEVPESRSISVGAPAAGRLEHARRLPAHPGFRVRRPGRAYGTDETVRWITDAFDALRRDDREAPRVEVHDLSFRTGGPIHGHHSHESGRDADISYFQARCPAGLCRFRRIGPAQLDVARQWRLFRHWLVNDRVTAIFVDHGLQEALYEHARASGESRANLSRWFQYPRAPENRYGVIRHHPRHADHFHVRFVCPENDPDCR